MTPSRVVVCRDRFVRLPLTCLAGVLGAGLAIAGARAAGGGPSRFIVDRCSSYAFSRQPRIRALTICSKRNCT